jgi:hypothetical protein
MEVAMIRFLLILLIIVAAMGLVRGAWGGTATLTWQAPTTNEDGVTPLTDLAGFKIYVGEGTANYSSSIDVGNVLTYTVENLVEGITYYFVATAYDTSGNESVYSNEVNKLIPDTVLPGAFAPFVEVQCEKDACIVIVKYTEPTLNEDNVTPLTDLKETTITLVVGNQVMERTIPANNPSGGAEVQQHFNIDKVKGTILMVSVTVHATDLFKNSSPLSAPVQGEVDGMAPNPLTIVAE